MDVRAQDMGVAASAWPAAFVHDLMPRWIGRAADARQGGFFDALDSEGIPLAEAPKTTLAQARALFTLAHLALVTHRSEFVDAAEHAHDFMAAALHDPVNGGYVRAVTREGRPTGNPEDRVTRSYDMSFVVLALATYARLTGRADVHARLDAAWGTVQFRLTDPVTGLLLEDDAVRDPAAADAPMRAQNPHMHMFEAALQAHEMTGDPRWLPRAAELADLGLRHFLDAPTGTVAEFRAPDLSPVAGPAGSLREIGHQCEWAWLLYRHARLSGDSSRLVSADRMMDFALRHGFCHEGPMRGAAFDAFDLADRRAVPTFLLWPQTEAGKAFAVLHEARDAYAAERAHDLMSLIASRYFTADSLACNQLDLSGRVLQPMALTRLLYHVVLFVTEGARTGLWEMAGPQQNEGGDPC